VKISQSEPIRHPRLRQPVETGKSGIPGGIFRLYGGEMPPELCFPVKIQLPEPAENAIFSWEKDTAAPKRCQGGKESRAGCRAIGLFTFNSCDC